MFEVEASGVDFADVGDEFGLGGVVALDQGLELCQEAVVGEILQVGHGW